MAAEFSYKKTITDIEAIQCILRAETKYQQEKNLITNRLQEKKGRSWLNFFKSGATETPSHLKANDATLNKPFKPK